MPPSSGASDEHDSKAADFDLRSFDLVREYVEYLTLRGVSKGPAAESSSLQRATDWDFIQRSVTGSESVEEAIGHAIVIADQVARGSIDIKRDETIVPRAEEVSRQPDALRPFLSVNLFSAIPDFGDRTRIRAVVAEKVAAHKTFASIALSVVMILIGISYSLSSHQGHGSVPARFVTPQVRIIDGNAQLTGNPQEGTPLQYAAALTSASPTSTSTTLPAATAPPVAAPPSLANAAPLRPHEVFGFAPYWTLDQSPEFDVTRLTTIAYFSIGVNPDGSLVESGPGWDGYQSQELADLVTRAHAAGDRVVLTVDCFDQSSLDQLTSSLTAPATLGTALIGAIRAKNLDGVNLDFEGKGSADQGGLTDLVTKVSAAIHDADPHYQVTMDTYASSAGDPDGFYDIRALAPAVNAFFVMEYQLNLQSGGSAASPLTSSMFSDRTAIDQYLAAVPSSKVILGLPFFGVDWPTSNGTLTALATGPVTPISYGQVMASGHPVYWDETTDTAWTSYQVGSQWHETFFEDPTSLYEAAEMAKASQLAGVGIWALGMDGNDPDMLSALLGFSSAVKGAPAGPAVTSESPLATSSTSTSTMITTLAPVIDPSEQSPTSTSTTGPAGANSGTSSSTGGATTTTQPAVTSTTTTTAGPQYSYSGTWNGETVNLTELSQNAIPSGSGLPIGQISDFATTDPSASCLSSDPPLTVETFNGYRDEYFAVATEPGDCVDAYFAFSA